MLQYNISDSTLWIVGGFLLITLVLGLYAGRGIKDIKEYALGNGNFSSFTIVLSVLATKIGGGTVIGFTDKIHSFGIIVTLATFAIGLRYFIVAKLIAPNITKFNNCLTVGDIIGNLYGKKMKFLSGILLMFYSFSMLLAQISLLGIATSSLLNIDFKLGILIGGGILVLYSTFGGIKSVTYTDVLQFLIIILIIPFIATLCLKKVGGYKSLFMNLPSTHFRIFSHPKFFNYLAYFLMIGIIPHTIIDPPVMQRLLMTKDNKQLKNQFYVISILDPIFRIVIMLIGLSAVMLFPNLKTMVMPKVINEILPLTMKGLAIASIFAVIMSTIDSALLACGILFSEDILKPIFDSKKWNFNRLNSAKISTIILGFTIIIITLIPIDYNFMRMIFWASKISSPLVFPLFIGILGLKTDKRSLILGIMSGILILLFCDYYLPKPMKQLSIAIGILTNGFVYMITHILQNKGIAWVQRDEIKEQEDEQKTNLWIPNPEKIINTIINSIPTPKKIYNYSRFQVMKNGSENMIFGIYCCVNFTLPYFLWDHQDPDKYNLMTNLRFIGGIMAGLLIVKDEWKKFLKPYYPLYWHATLTYCLPFITTVMFLLSGGSLLWLIQVAISIFFLIMLVAGEVFLILAPLGISLGLLFYKYFVGPINIFSLGFDINYYLIYAFFFPTIIGLLFAYKKKIFNKETSNIGINLGLSLCHEIRNTLSALSYTDMAKRKMERIEEMSSLETRDGKKVLIIKENSFKSVHNDVDIALGLNQDSVKVLRAFENLFIEYKKSNISLQIDSVEEIVRDTLSDLHFLPGQLENIHLDLRDDFFIQLPKAQFAFVLSNIIRNAFKHGGPSKLEIKSENNKLVIRDNGKGIPESDIERIFQMGYTTGNKGESSGIGLWFSKIIITSFNGEIKCNSEQGENSYTEFIIKFPEIDPSKITEEDKKRINIKKSKRLRKLEKEEIAIKMLEGKKSIKEIEEYTNLTKSQIEEIKKKL